MLIGAHLPFDAPTFERPESEGFHQALRAPHWGLPGCQWRGDAFLVGNAQAQTAQGQHVLFTGHIQNRAELRTSLGLADADDAALYAAAFQAWGDQADLRVIGEFATIVLWPNAPRMRISASPNICPPLHYAHDGRQFFVASRPQALFDSQRLTRRLSEQKLADSLYLNYFDRTQGWFKGVTRLASGTRAHISPAGVQLESYYSLENLPRITLPRDQDYVEAAQALFSEGTQRMLDGFQAPCVSLSGRFDSQAVAYFAMQARPNQPLRSYTGVPEAGFDGVISDSRFADERPYAQALADMHPQLQPSWIDAAGKSFDYFQREMFEMGLQAPRNAMNLHWIHEIYRQGRLDGCDVVLTGSFGNATFSFGGEQALPGWLRRGQWARFARELWAAGPPMGLPRRFISQGIMPLLPRRLWAAITRLRHGAPDDPFATWCPMNADYALEMQVEERAQAHGFDALFRPLPDSRELRAKMLRMAGGEGADIMQAMRLVHGMQMRDPTSYRPLAEFCISIPDDQYLRGGVRRWLARRMLRGKLPDMVLRENRRGRQAADWHLRIARQRDDLISEIDWLQEDPNMRRRLNLAALRQALVDFPTTTPSDKIAAQRLQLALSRGLTTARFIRYIEGRNA